MSAKKAPSSRTGQKAVGNKASGSQRKGATKQRRPDKSRPSQGCRQGLFQGRRSWWLAMGFVLASLLFWGGGYVARQVELDFQSPIAITWTGEKKRVAQKKGEARGQGAQLPSEAKPRDSREAQGPSTVGVSRKLSAQEGVERARFFYYLPRANEPGSFRLASLQQNFSQPISYGQLFRRLFHGPDETFRDGGYLSALPRELRLLGLEHRSEDGILRLNVSRHLEEGGGKLVYLRLQQLVFTALELPGVRRVELLVEGRRRSHLSGDGVVIPRYLDGEFFRGRDILADSG